MPQYLFLRIFILVLILCFPINGYGYEDNPAEPTLEDEVEQLKAVNAAWEYNQRELLKFSRQENIPASEIAEYTEFVNELKHAVVRGCQTLHSGGVDENAHGVNCAQIEGDPQAAGARKAGDIQREATSQEKAEDLKGKLRQLETELDDMLLKGQERVSKESTERPSSAGSGLEGEIGQQIKKAEEQLQKMEGQPQDTASGQAEGGTGSARAGTGAGAGSVSAKEGEPGAGTGKEKQGELPAARPDDIDDGSDDDVVARQLREAAEAETDPVLKEQLWDEYRKYKNSRR